MFPATARGLTSTTAVEQNLKDTYTEYNVELTKKYCITVSIEKISSIHTFILKTEQILGSHELNKCLHPFFDYTQSQISEITFSFREFAATCKKSVHPIYSFLRCSQF